MVSFRGRHDVVDASVQPHYLPIIILIDYRIRAFVDEIDEHPSFPVYPDVRSLELPSVCFRIALCKELRN